jgi:hypothetical protein
MIRGTLYIFSWVLCVVILAGLIGQPEALSLWLRGLGLPGSVVDIFLANRGVQIVTALSAVLVVGYGLPYAINWAIKLARLDRINASITAVRHDRRSLAALEELVENNETLHAHLSPVAAWAFEQTDVTGEVRIAVRRWPSEMMPADQLANDQSFLAYGRFLPKLLIAIALAITLLMLSLSSDKAFAEILSVSGTDYGTMILGVRSATAAMAIALLAATVVATVQALFEARGRKISAYIVRGLDQLVVCHTIDAAQLTPPVAEPLQQKNDSATLVAIHQMIRSNDEKQLSLLAAVQQSMAELQALRQDVDALRDDALPHLPPVSDLPHVGSITTALRALKESASNELPQL